MTASSLTVAEFIAEYLESRQIKHVFGIIGAGNAAIFDAISRRGYTEIVCTHHEQAAVMAASAYYRTNGTVTCALVTTGAGSTNAVTGVMSAWMDSVPVVVISGNESTKNIQAYQGMRAYGVQGYDSVKMVQDCTNYALRIDNSVDFKNKLKLAFGKSTGMYSRKGPVWIDIPMDVQTQDISEPKCVDLDFEMINRFIQGSKRPVLYLGRGAEELGEYWISHFGMPILLSWSAIDLLGHDHPMNFGSCGVYGQRSANYIIEEADLVLCIGTRLALPQIGYNLQSFAKQATLIYFDVDQQEVEKIKTRTPYSYCWSSYGVYRNINKIDASKEWLNRCNELKAKYPRIESIHHTGEGLNSYIFMDELSKYLKPDSVIVTDVGAALLSGHYGLRIKKGQRLFTSQGLGEMGYALPAAIGASFARNKGEVICLVGDGGLMMNLQELQTIVHHQLPIKIFVFNNDGYGMIKGTQKQLFGGRYVGTDPKSGVSCTGVSSLAHAFGLPFYWFGSKDLMSECIERIMQETGPVICEIVMDPEQEFLPKLKSYQNEKGEMCTPAFNQLSPLES